MNHNTSNICLCRNKYSTEQHTEDQCYTLELYENVHQKHTSLYITSQINLFHLDHKCGGAGLKIIIHSYSGEYLIRNTERSILRRHK